LDNDIIFKIAERNCWMSDIDRLVNLYWAVGQTLHFGVEGDVVEIGCHAGGTSVFLQMLIDNFAPGRTLHLYDSFQGMPEPGPKDAYLVKGDRPSTIDQIHQTFAHFDLPVPEIHPGWFEDTLPGQLPPQIAAAYLDGDFYDSIMISLSAVWPRLSPNGIIIVDDYADLERAPNAFAKLPGVKLACDEFFAELDTRPFVLVGGNTLAFAGIRKPAQARPAHQSGLVESGRASQPGTPPLLFVARMIHTVPEVPSDVAAAHWHWGEANYAAGVFVASGPSAGGGVALAGGCSRVDLERLLKTDPVVAAGMGRYEITECSVSRSTPGFMELLDCPAARRPNLLAGKAVKPASPGAASRVRNGTPAPKMPGRPGIKDHRGGGGQH
jgi:O-methyltransferase